jgi:methylmalonyl-CoA/ethylmalonyl-CoA epimerase
MHLIIGGFKMADQPLGTTTITQVGIIVKDIEARARAWADTLGLPMPEIRVTDTVDIAQTEYQGKPSTAQAKLAFFHLGQVDVELIEPTIPDDLWPELDAIAGAAARTG